VIAGIPDLESGDAADRTRQIDGIVVAEREAGSVRAPLVAIESVSARRIAIGSVRARLMAIVCVGRSPCGMPPAGHGAPMVTM